MKNTMELKVNEGKGVLALAKEKEEREFVFGQEAGRLCQIFDGFMELQVDNINDAERHCDVAEHCAEHCGDAEYNAESAASYQLGTQRMPF